MAENHISYFDAQPIRRGVMADCAPDFIGDRHVPYQLGFEVVKAVMAETSVTEVVADQPAPITQEVADSPLVREAIERELAASHPNGKSGPTLRHLRAIRLWLNHATFADDVRLHEAELDYTKQAFKDRVVWAINHQGLPLKSMQVLDRIDNTVLGFKHELEGEDANGNYYGSLGFSIVRNGRLTSEKTHTTFHELFHGLSGHRFTKNDEEGPSLDTPRVGFRTCQKRPVPTKDISSRIWMNEAFTEILTTVFHDERGMLLDFSNPTQSITEIGNGVIYSILGINDSSTELDDPHAYTAEKVAFIRIMSKVPLRTLLRAYFVQDFDPYEFDQYAGTRAEKDLQRAFKAVGGTQRIQELRAIDQAFQNEKPDEALALASQIQKQDAPSNGIKRAINTRRVRRNTKKVQGKILRANQLKAA